MEYKELTPDQTIQLEREKAKIEKEITRIEKSLEIGDKLDRLMKTEDFKDVFLEYYLKDEVIRETMLLAEQYFLEADQRQSLQDGLIAKAHFNDWITSVTSMGILSKGRLEEHRQRIKEIDDMLTAGYPVVDTQVAPPEGE